MRDLPSLRRLLPRTVRWFAASGGSVVHSRSWPLLCLVAWSVGSGLILAASPSGTDDEAASPETVSYAAQIRPFLQAKCFGCHQPNQQQGGLDLTRPEALFAAADSGQPAVVAGHPDQSPLLEVVSTKNGAPAMPPTGVPLTDAEQTLLRQWIAEGAANDWVSPYRVPTTESPPEYRRLPPVTALDLSTQHGRLAVAGVHEVWLLDAADRSVLHRLIGLSPRIESLRFSPDGTRLAVAGGRPGEFGELQVWDCQSGELLWSRSVTGDVVRGLSWSPDGSRLAIGCTDKSVRGFEANSGEQILFQNAAEDWVHDTVFSVDGSHLISVGRDRACKLTEVATERFIDNITSITPGVLKGGIAAVARHPQRDEILIGGADGVPKLYRIHRLTTRVIGDDANLIRRFPPLEGGIQAVAISPNGQHFGVVTSLDGRGQLRVYAYDFDTALPPEIAPLLTKVVGTRTAEEEQMLEAYVTRDVKLVTELSLPVGLYALAYSADSQHLWLGDADGRLRQVEVASGQVLWEGSPIGLLPPSDALSTESHWQWSGVQPSTTPAATAAGANESPATTDIETATIRALRVHPPRIELTSAADYAQVVVMGQLPDGTWVDVTRSSTFAADGVSVDSAGLVHVASGLEQDGATSVNVSTAAPALRIAVGDQRLEVPLVVAATEPEIEFVRDVQPMLTRLGCNAGSCHGAADGKNGFKLSLRGYDPLFDLRSLTDELWMRRVNVAQPDQSLMLQKALGAVPHQGGALIQADSRAYSLLHQWIATGAGLEAEPVRTVSIELQPSLPVLLAAGGQQQMRVVASLSDGSQRDVTREAFVEIGDLEIAQVTPTSRVTALRRGETPVMARYDGCYVATTLTVMGDRSGFVWQAPPTFNRIDELVAEKWRRMKIQPAELCSDYEFIRRVTLDLTGLPPTVEQVQAFVSDPRPTQVKRDEWIDRLLLEPAFVDYWTNKWADLLQVNSKFLGNEGVTAFHAWIRQQVADNVPYDQFVRSIVTASGSNRDQPAAAYFKILRDPDLMMENTTHLFLATRFNCNKCHDHPFERWTQDQYFETAAFFAQTGLSEDPQSEGKRIGGSAVEGAKPLFETVFDKPDGEMIHERTRGVVAPKFPFALNATATNPTATNPTATDAATAGEASPTTAAVSLEVPETGGNAGGSEGGNVEQSRREQFADWLVSRDNPYFATSYVNRVWGYLLGRGLIEPLDDLRASNPPSNPELLSFLEQSFLESGFNTRELLAMICKSRTYQLAVDTNPYNADDTLNYSRAKAKRLPAEVLFDAMHQSVGAELRIPGVPAGTRAAQLRDVAVNLPSGFLATLGRPVRESACECERSDELQLGAVLAMVSGPDVARLIADPNNTITRLAADPNLSEPELIDAIYQQVLNRPATTAEIEGVLAHVAEIQAADRHLAEAVADRQTWWEAEGSRLESERAASIEQATLALQAAIAAHDPELLQKEQDRESQMAAAQAELDAYSANESDAFLRWRQEQLSDSGWYTPVPLERSQSNDSQLTLLPDRSLRATLGGGPVETTLVFETQAPRVTGFRLEALADPELSSGGPGLAPNGNFVVSEWIIEYASLAEPETWQKVAIRHSHADFHQGGFSTDKLFNGVTDNNGDGWAVHPATKQTHWVVATLAEPVELPQGSRWRMRLVQNYNDGLHVLGRFRVSFATRTDGAASHLSLGLAEPLLVELANVPLEGDTPLLERVAEPIRASFRASDSRRQALSERLAAAQRPLTIAEEIQQCRAALALAQRPVPEDRLLQALLADRQSSQTQLQQLRLTLAQDLTWALLNSPAFMFNH